jgi:hypothetical protein
MHAALRWKIRGEGTMVPRFTSRTHIIKITEDYNGQTDWI